MDKFYMVYVEEGSNSTVRYANQKYAEEAAQCKANEFNSKAFVLETNSVINPDEINVIVDSYEAALKYLGREGDVWMCGMADKHINAMSAMYKLVTIAEAWNKADEFVPDFDNINQYRWFPWFRKQGAKGFVFASTYHAETGAAAYFGSRLCFKSEERAIQFGKQFTNLWNDFLL